MFSWVYNSNVHPLKQLFKIAVQKFLRLLVKIKLAKSKASIIGITGSFGKTSTKEAVYEVLKTKWAVYRNPKSLNTEIGILLAILEQPSGFRSFSKWFSILVRATLNAFREKKYDYIVLEYGADKPGDIEHLIPVVKPDIAIITNIAATHQAKGQFENAEEVFKEKRKLVSCLSESDIAILNGADELLKTLKGKLKAKTFWFNDGDIRADSLVNTQNGFSAVIRAPGQQITGEFKIPGTYHINVLLPAILCGMLAGIPMKDGIKALSGFKLPPGRMSIIKGKNEARLLDSSYNASPETMKQALAVLHDFPAKKRIAVLGNMNELGDYSEKAHREIGRIIGLWLDFLAIVGGEAAYIAEEALKRGYPGSKIKILSTSKEAGEFLSGIIGKGDVILFKGSQNGVRLERAVKMLMENPAEAKKLLCRQEKEWEFIK